MPITVDCPNCKAKLNIPDGAAGKKAKCPKCQALMTVPQAGVGEGAIAVEAAEDAERDLARGLARPRPVRPGIGVGLFSAVVTVAAFAALGVVGWLGMDGSTIVNQVCIYSAIGLAVVGLLSSLYSRGALRVLDFLFGAMALAACALSMLVFTGTAWPDAFHDAGTAVKVAEVYTKPHYVEGDIGYMHGDEDGDLRNTYGWLDRGEMNEIMPLAILGGKNAKSPENRQVRLKTARAEGKVFTLTNKTKVKVLVFDTNIQVEVLEGEHQGKKLWIFAQSSVQPNPQ